MINTHYQAFIVLKYVLKFIRHFKFIRHYILLLVNCIWDHLGLGEFKILEL